MHDADTMQRHHAISEGLTHAPDLPISSFRQNNPEPFGRHPFHPTGFGWAPEYDHSCGHLIEKRLIEWTVDRHLVFPFMAVLGP